MGNKSSINRAEKLKEWSVNASEREAYSENLISWKENVKSIQIWFFRLKMTSKSNGQSRKEAGQRAAGIYGRYLDYHLIDLCSDNLSEEA
jgi:hypothetical protein